MKARPKTLKEFSADLRAPECNICALPESVTRQILKRPRDTCRLDIVVAWLAQEYNVHVTIDDFRRHQRGRHHTSKSRHVGA